MIENLGETPAAAVGEALHLAIHIGERPGKTHRVMLGKQDFGLVVGAGALSLSGGRDLRPPLLSAMIHDT